MHRMNKKITNTCDRRRPRSTQPTACNAVREPFRRACVVAILHAIQQPQQQQQPSLFGQPQQQPQQSTGLFGSLAQPSTNLGGSTLFGNTQPGNSFLGLSNAGASTSNLFAPKTSLVQTQPQGDSAQAQFIGLVQKIEATAQAWDASSPQCRFQVSLITTCSTEWHF